eukprot:TRINITY_DN39067_c0_g1_i1.p1 TRINITY_DN39067_c0_g1~~TRINITY_DN39067_c0_g1_i1.p1  ORF type:complete len:335 (-),score=52.42 TRINITY_DN39067_c0_g1_i1:162-1166(-)
MGSIAAQLWSNFLHRGHLQFCIALFFASFTVYVHSSTSWSYLLFGEDRLNSLTYWFIAVPIYIFLAIYFLRFLGSFLMRIWLREVSESVRLREAAIKMAAGLIQDARVPALFAKLMQSPTIVCALSELTAAVLDSAEVQAASSQTTAAVVSSRQVQEATASSCCTLLAHPRLLEETRRAVECELRSDRLDSLLATRVAGILTDARLEQACARLVSDLLENHDLRRGLRKRAASVAGDPAVIGASCRSLGAVLHCSAPTGALAPDWRSSSIDGSVPEDEHELRERIPAICQGSSIKEELADFQPSARCETRHSACYRQDQHCNGNAGQASQAFQI